MTRNPGELQYEQNHFSSISDALTAGFSSESKEKIDSIVREGRKIATDAKIYIRDNPREAAGLLVASGAILWALFGTRPGRSLVALGSPKLSQWFAKQITETFQVAPRILQ